MSEESIIIGRNSVWEALQAGRSISKIYIAAGNTAAPLLRIKEYARERDILVETVPSKVLHHLVPDGRHQGVVAFGAAVSFADLTEVLAGVAEKVEVPFLVLLDGIEDVHNLGAIIRTAECAGAIEYMPIVPIGNSVQLLNRLKKRGFWVIGADMDGETDYFHSSLTEPIVLVIGSEGKGISRLVKETCDVLVQIPMFGHINSLNASVAAALLMYEVVRQRQAVTKK